MNVWSQATGQDAAQELLLMVPIGGRNGLRSIHMARPRVFRGHEPLGKPENTSLALSLSSIFQCPARTRRLRCFVPPPQKKFMVELIPPISGVSEEPWLSIRCKVRWQPV